MRAGSSKHGFPTPTEGHTQLLQAIKSRSVKEVASLLSVTPPAIYAIFREQRPPATRLATRMTALLGIVRADWYVAPRYKQVIEASFEDGI